MLEGVDFANHFNLHRFAYSFSASKIFGKTE